MSTHDNTTLQYRALVRQARAMIDRAIRDRLHKENQKQWDNARPSTCQMR